MRKHVSWRALVEEFLEYRRHLGYADYAKSFYLRKFAQYAQQRRAKSLTAQLQIDWICTFPGQSTRAYVASSLRLFAKYRQKFDSHADTVPSGCYECRRQRKIPHIFSEEELAEILKATPILSPRDGLRPLTYRALFGLLASSGLRTSEALRLTRSDVDLENGVLSVRDSKRHKSRFVPLHSTTVRALTLYSRHLENRLPKRLCDRFFVTNDGRPLWHASPDYALRRITKVLHLKVRGDYPRHRVRDFRHTFVVMNILRALRRGLSFDQLSLELATYIGHENIGCTYWYITAIPELLARAGKRFHRCAEVLP